MLREQHRDDHVRGVSLEEREGRYLENLRGSAEFRFYASVQRSWCIARATKAAHLTLSLLPEEEREQLLDEWVSSGSGGAQSFFRVEAEAFLDFISGRLSDRSCELTVSQFERATLRASEGANLFVAPDPADLKRPDSCVRRGRYAALIRFDVDPEQLAQSAVQKNPLLRGLFSAGLILMLSPGLPQLWREPSAEEVDLWDALGSPSAVATLCAAGHALETLETVLSDGAVEYADN